MDWTYRSMTCVQLIYTTTTTTEGAYSGPANPLVGGRGWLSPPKNLIPPLSAFVVVVGDW